jgi:hypothetical protein
MNAPFRSCLSSRAAVAALVAVAPALLYPKSVAGERHSAKQQVQGVVVSVQAHQITIAGPDGTQVTLKTERDLTAEGLVGAQVSASYRHTEEGDTLESLNYSFESFPVPPETYRYKIKTFVILPKSEVPEADSLFDAIEHYLRVNLRWRAKPRMLAEEVRRRHGEDSQGSISTLAAMDPSTGKFDLSRYLQKSPSLIPAVAEQTRVNAVLQVDVLQVKAKVHDLVASWDNMQEPVGEKHRDFLIFPILPINGKVDAATVVMKLWDPDGRLLWSNRRGLAVLQVLQPKGYKLRERPLSAVLQDSDAVERWLKAAMGKLVGSDAEEIF